MAAKKTKPRFNPRARRPQTATPWQVWPSGDFDRAYAARVAGGVTKHTCADVDTSPVNASVSISNPTDAPRFVWSSQAALDVVAERRRQIEVENRDLLHDQQYVRDELAYASICYATPQFSFSGVPEDWPFPPSAWKPKDRRSNLVRAAALLVAEIERIDFQSHSVDAVMTDIEKANFFARSDAPPPVVFDGILSTSTKVVDIWDTLKDLGRLILCEIKMRDDSIAQALNGKRAYFSCGESFTWMSPFGLSTEYYLRPVDDAIAEAFVSFGLVDLNQKPCIASGDVVVVNEGISELAAPTPPKIICYTVHDLGRKSSVLAAMGNFDVGIPENLTALYSECLAIAATENLEFLQLMYFLDVGTRALFRA